MSPKKIKKIKKRDGRIVDFDQSKITTVIFKAITATGQGDGKKADRLSERVVQILNRRFEKDEIPTVEQIQDIVEEVLILENLVETAKAYILYREQRRRIREATTAAEEAVDRVDQYLEKLDWEVQENANMAFSLQGLNHYGVSYIVKKYWLNKICPKEIREANESGDLHIHNLDTLGCYCAGWDLYDFLLKGFGGVRGKVESKPPKHLRTALGQAVNFIFTIQGEVAGAVAFSNFDTLLAPFIRYDNLNYQQVKQALQEFLFNMAIPTRVGFQNPFSNITLDLQPSPAFAKQPIIIGGKSQKETYGEFEEEMKIFNKALYEVIMEGDRNSRPFSFPIPTINITKDFPWQEPAFDGIFESSAKYGTNYFANYINSEMEPDDCKSMCCRLRLDLRELYNRGGGGLFGSGNLTGSIGVVTINLPRIGYLSKTKKDFFERLAKIMDLAKESLEIKRKTIENFITKGLYPYSKFYLEGIKKMRGEYYANHFSTIGLVGMNEALSNFIGENIASRRGRRFAIEVLDFMRERLVKYQKETGNIYNLEATPAESSLAPDEKVLISQSDPKMLEIGPLIDQYFGKNQDKIQIMGNSEVLKLPERELYTYGFNRNTQKIKKYPVTALVRHRGKEIYEITTISGRKVKVTGDHSIFTLSEGGEAVEILAKEIKQKDFIAIPKRIEMEEIHKEFNLIEVFENWLEKNKLYAIFPIEFIRELISNKKVKQWAQNYYKFAWENVKHLWQKNRVIPLQLIYDLNLRPNKNTLGLTRIFYRQSKNTKTIKALIPINKDFGFMIGGLLSEGWMGKRPEFTNHNLKFTKKFVESINNILGEGLAKFSAQQGRREKRYNVTLSKIIGDFLKQVGVQGKSAQKELPSFLFFASRETIAGVLRGFYLGDGSKYENKKRNDFSIRLYTNSEKLVEGLNICLLKLGILAKIRIDRKSKVSPMWRDGFVLSITGTDNLKKFFKIILDKDLRLKGVHSGREIIPFVPKLIKELLQKYSLKPSQIGIWKDCLNRNVRLNRISIQYLRGILKKLEKFIGPKDAVLEKLKRILNSDLYWDKIKQIKILPSSKYVYDLEVDAKKDLVENFLGGRGLVCVHNTAYRLSLKDKEKYPDIITAGTKQVPFYTNSSQLPVNYTDDTFEALKLQDEIQCKYSGGTILHLFLGERVSDIQTVKSLIKKIFEKFHLPYITLTPTFSICPAHGYLSGEHFYCPKCTIKQPCEVYSRIVGYYRPVNQFNIGKQQEFHERKTFKISKSRL